MTATVELPSLSYQEGRLLMDEKARARGIPSSRTITAVYQVTGEFSQAAFDEALSTVVDRHEALRTSFPGDASRQVVRGTAAVRCEVLDLTDPQDLPAIIDVEQRTQFAPEDCPRLRAKVLRASPAEHYVVLVFDHLVVDAWSRGLLLTELSQAYAAARAGEHHGLEPVAYTYRDYVRDRHAVLDGPDRARLLDFWSQNLHGVGAIPALSLPRAIAGPVGGAGVSRTLAPELADSLRGVAARSRATLFMVLLAAVQTTLANLSGRPDQSIAANIYNRDTVGTERLVAPMAEMMVVRTDLTGADTFTEALHRVRSSSLDAQEHAELPYAELVKALNPDQYADPDAPIGVVFNMLYAEVGAHGLDLPGATCERVAVAAVGTRRLRSELVIGAEVGPSGIRLSGQYQTDRLTEQDVTGVLDGIVDVLTAVGTS